MMNRIIAYSIGFFLVGILFPIALAEVYSANTTGWSSSVITVFQTVLPIIAVLGIAIDFIRRKD